MGYLLGNVWSGGASPVTLPSWYAAATANQWTELANSTFSLSGVGWSGTSPGGTSNYGAVVDAWSGGVLNTVGCYYGGAFHNGTFLVLFGGGHGDYGGNEVYAFGPLEDDAPAWHRLIDPTIPAPDDVARDASGNPVSRHTYDTLVYLPTLNKMLCIGAPGYYHTGSAFNVADLFDFAANTWSAADTNFPAYGGGGVGTINLLSAYNQTTGKAWGLGGGNANKLGCYDTATGAWSSYSKDNPNAPSDSKAAIDPNNNRFVFIDSNGAVAVQDLSDPTSAIYTATVTGAGPSGITVLDYDTAGQRFVAWDDEGKKLYFLTFSDATNAAWTSDSPASGATPAAQTANGTFGRFRMVNGSLRCALVMPAADAPICIYKMAA